MVIGKEGYNAKTDEDRDYINGYLAAVFGEVRLPSEEYWRMGFKDGYADLEDKTWCICLGRSTTRILDLLKNNADPIPGTRLILKTVEIGKGPEYWYWVDPFHQMVEEPSENGSWWVYTRRLGSPAWSKIDKTP
jgi:hypothetical protein